MRIMPPLFYRRMWMEEYIKPPKQLYVSKSVKKRFPHLVKPFSPKLLLGKCAPCIKENATKVHVPSLEFDEWLLMYFERKDTYFAHDAQKMCKDGDIVLIRELPEKMTTLITHELVKILYPLGDLVDPVTGRRVYNQSRRDTRFRDEMEEIEKLYGDWPHRFKYDEAPPRGWQEGKKDFSHRDSYVKYYVDDTEQPYALD